MFLFYITLIFLHYLASFRLLRWFHLYEKQWNMKYLIASFWRILSSIILCWIDPNIDSQSRVKFYWQNVQWSWPLRLLIIKPLFHFNNMSHNQTVPISIFIWRHNNSIQRDSSCCSITTCIWWVYDNVKLKASFVAVQYRYQLNISVSWVQNHLTYRTFGTSTSS